MMIDVLLTHSQVFKKLQINFEYIMFAKFECLINNQFWLIFPTDMAYDNFSNGSFKHIIGCLREFSKSLKLLLFF